MLPLLLLLLNDLDQLCLIDQLFVEVVTELGSTGLVFLMLVIAMMASWAYSSGRRDDGRALQRLRLELRHLAVQRVVSLVMR